MLRIGIERKESKWRNEHLCECAAQFLASALRAQGLSLYMSNEPAIAIVDRRARATPLCVSTVQGMQDTSGAADGRGRQFQNLARFANPRSQHAPNRQPSCTRQHDPRVRGAEAVRDHDGGAT